MALKYVSMGSLDTFHQYDDTEFSYAFCTDGGVYFPGMLLGLLTTTVLDIGAVGPSSSVDTNVTVIGAIEGAMVILGIPNSAMTGVNCTNITIMAWVSTVDVVTIRVINNSTTLTADPGSGTFTVGVLNIYV